MPFFPDSAYGIAYLVALIIFGAITMLGPNRLARRVLAVLAVQWFLTRTIDVIDHDNFILWIMQDYAVFVAFIFCRGGTVAFVCASLVLIVLGFDGYSLVAGGSFEGAAAVAEAIGYVSMIVMAGGAHADRGKLQRKLANDSGNLRTGIGRLLDTGKSWFSVE